MSGKGISGEASLRFAPVALSVLALLGRCQKRIDGPEVWTDPKTGCEFLFMDNGPRGGTAIAERRDASGKQICRDPRQ